MDQDRSVVFSYGINDLFGAGGSVIPVGSRMQVASVRAVAGKAHGTVFHLPQHRGPQFPRSWRRQFQARNLQWGGFGWGDGAMWIIWYIGMMASLRGRGPAPSLVPIRTDEDRTPFGDV